MALAPTDTTLVTVESYFDGLKKHIISKNRRTGFVYKGLFYISEIDKPIDSNYHCKVYSLALLPFSLNLLPVFLILLGVSEIKLQSKLNHRKPYDHQYKHISNIRLYPNA